MTETKKESRRAYYKEWRKKNPDKVREKNSKYWAKNADRINAQRREKYAKERAE